MEFERGLWTAAREDDLSKVKDLLRKGHDPSKPDSAGFTSLHYAVRSARAEIIEALLKGGSNPNAQTSGGKATPLHRACSKGRPEIVKLLLSTNF